jgi:hypothetical protein
MAVDHEVEFSAGVMAFRPLSNAMALANRYRLLRIARRDGKILKRVELGHPVDHLAYSPRGTYLLAADSAGSCTILSSTGTVLKRLSLDCRVVEIGLSRGAEKIAIISDGNGVVLVDTDSLTTWSYQDGDSAVAGSIADEINLALYLKKDGTLILLDIAENTPMSLPGESGLKLLSTDADIRDFVLYSRANTGAGELQWCRLVDEDGSKQEKEGSPQSRSGKKRPETGPKGETIDYVELD